MIVSQMRSIPHTCTCTTCMSCIFITGAMLCIDIQYGTYMYMPEKHTHHFFCSFLSPSLSPLLTYMYMYTHTLSFSHTLSLSRTLSLSHSPSYTLPLTHTHTISLSPPPLTLPTSHHVVQHELTRAHVFLETMGYKARTEVRNVDINLSYQEAKEYARIFKQFDKDKDGHISIHDLRKALHVCM